MSEHHPTDRGRLYSLRIFCDFDGTISSVDIGDELFKQFGRREPWHEKLMTREIHIRDYWQQMARQLRGPLRLEELDEFLRSIPIDPGFAGLHALALEEGIPFMIVSDGFDLYIERYLAMNGYEGIEFRCNHAVLDDEGRMTVTYPLAAEGCNCFCATCKRNVVISASAPDDRIVYIGDGVSDFCPAEHADIIFAKKKLAAYCNEKRLPHYPFSTLEDVHRQLRLLLDRRRIRPRHQAVLARKRAWEAE